MDSSICEHDANVNTCIVLNKAAQHLIPDLLKCIHDEVHQLSLKQKQLEEGSRGPRTLEQSLRRPFLRLPNELPPLNEDAWIRRERREVNLTDAKSAALRRWCRRDLIALTMGVARCARDRQVALLTAQRDALLSKLAASKSRAKEAEGPPYTPSEVTAELLTNLRSVEDRLEKFRSLRPRPPKGLIAALVSVTLDAKSRSITPQTKKMQALWRERIFDGYRGPKFIREHNAQTWRELLTSADDLLRSNEWQEIAANEVCTTVSDTNLRLTWYHRLRPQLNHGNWTEEEDMKLTDLVKRYGQHGKWDSIAKDLSTGRTAFACIQRWQMALNPDFSFKRAWAAEEDVALLDILKRLLEHYPPSLIDWDVVAAFHTTRSAKECCARAKVINPAFSTSSTNVACSQLLGGNMGDKTKRVRRFSPNEDLQLLMSIQRYGLAGGPMGIGGGIGVGSWALICSALPGRTPRACQQRYLELCEQFRPWTYTEDRKLYQLRLQFATNSSITDEKQLLWLKPFFSMVKYFPGRSMLALKKRFLLLYRFSRIWAELRRLTTQQACSSSVDCNSSEDDGLIHGVSEMRQLLLYSPFTTLLISRLRHQGVADPETEALRLLTNWEKGKSLTTEFSNIPETVDTEFCQLLEDLDNDRIAPCPLIADVPRESTVSKFAEDQEYQEDNEITFTGQPIWYSSKRIVSLVLTKQFLVKPIRKHLLSILDRSLVRRSRSSHSLLMASMLNETELTAHLNSLTSSHFKLRIRKRATAAVLLLKDRNRFGVALDRALKLPGIVYALSKRNTIASLPKLAPTISGIMIRQVSVEEKSNDSSKVEASTKPQASGASVSSNIPESVPRTNTTESNNSCTQRRLKGTGHSLFDQLGSCRKFQQLMEIRRILSRRGARGTDAYSLNKVTWLNEQVAASTSAFEKRQARSIPLMLRQLPWRIAYEFQQDPMPILDTCVQSSRCALLDGLGLTSTANSGSVRAIPPNYATIFAMKSLLLHIPVLVRHSQDRFIQYIRARASLNSAASDSRELHEVDMESNSAVVGDTNLSTSRQVILFPEYQRFIRVGLNLLLWPALLSTLSATGFTKSGKRYWSEAFNQIPLEILNAETPANKISRRIPAQAKSNISSASSSSEEEESGDQSSGSGSYNSTPRAVWNLKSSSKGPSSRRVTRRQGRPLRCAYSFRSKTIRNRQAEYSFCLNMFENTDEAFTIILPASVRTMFACGFRAHFISRIAK